MAYELIEGFEFQTASPIAFANDGAAMFSSSTNASIQTAAPKNGLANVRLSPTTTASGFLGRTLAQGVSASQTKSISFYFRIVTIPTSNGVMARIGGTAIMRIEFDIATGKLALNHSASGGVTPFGPVLAADTWYLVDWLVDMSTTTHTQRGMVDGDVGTEGVRNTTSQTIQTMGTIQIGTTGVTGPAYVADYDDWVATDTSADYPIGEHRVVGRTPNADGAHNPGVNTIERDDSTDITGSTTDAWTLVDNFPPSNSTYIKQSAVSSTNYAEIAFEDTEVGDAILAASIYAAIEGAAGGTSGANIAVLDAADNVLATLGNAVNSVSGTTRRYSQKLIPAPGGSWDSTEFNGLKARIGFATDVVPAPRYLALLLQYATLVTAADTVSAPVIDHTLTPISPVVQSQAIAVDTISHVLQPIAPAITFDTIPATITPTIISHTLQAIAPQVGDIEVTFGDYSDIYDDVYAPGGTIDHTLQAFAITVSFGAGGIEVGALLVDHTLTLYDLTLEADQFITSPELINHTLTPIDPTVTFDAVPTSVSPTLINHTLAFFTPVIQGPITPTLINHTLQAIQPVVQPTIIDETPEGMPRLIAEMDFGVGWENVRGFLRTFSWQRGRARERERMGAGTAQATFDNRTGRFDRDLHPEVRPNRPVRFAAAIDTGIGPMRMGKSPLGAIDAMGGGSVELPIFTGRTEGGPVAFSNTKADSFVAWSMVDASKRMNRDRSGSGFGSGDELTGDRVDAVLDGATPVWDGGLRDIDEGRREVQLATGTLGRFDYLLQVAESEGGGFFFDAAGKAVFRGFDHAPNPDPVPFGDVAGEQRYLDITIEDDDKEIFNAITVTAPGIADVTVTDTESMAEFGRADLIISTILSNGLDMAELADSVLAGYSQPRKRVARVVMGARGTDWRAVLGKTLLDRLVVRHRPQYGPGSGDPSGWGE